jgi:D-arginine dehydrogenase
MALRVAVIGGGIAGVSAGYYLARAGADVSILEQEEVLAFHSTGRSAAVYFENYGAEANRFLTRASRAFFNDPPPGLADHSLLAARGALWVGRPDQMGSLQSLLGEEAEADNSARWLEPGEAVARVPVLRQELVGGAVWEPTVLDLDVAAVHQGFVRGLRAAGGIILTSYRVSSLTRRDGSWVVGAGDHELVVDVVVNAAGAWGDAVGSMAGASTIGLRPLRRTAFMVPGAEAWSAWPLTSNVDNEFYFRPDGSQLLCSLAEENPSDPGDARPEQLDIALAIDRINRHTTLDITVVRSSWTGLRSFVADRAMVIGFDRIAPSFFWLVGQGGTGIQTSPAAGELTAALIIQGETPARLLEHGVDPSALSLERLQPAAP